MLEYGDPLDAIVAIWHRTVYAGGKFLGSGAFISPRFVLTAKHVIEGKAPREIFLDFVNRNPRVPVHETHFHEKFDIGLIELEKEFSRQSLVGFDCKNADLDRKTVALYAVNPDSESPESLGDYPLHWNSESGEYLFPHQPRKGHSGGIAVFDGYAIGVIVERHESDQQGIIVPLYTVADWFGRFPELKRTFVSPQPPVSSLSQIPQNEFTRKVRDQILSLLKQTRAQLLHDAIVQQAGEESVADALVPQQLVDPIRALDLLHFATKDCLQKLAEQNPHMINHAKEVAREIFGWLVLLAVDKDKVNSSGCAFDPWQDGIDVAIPLETEAGTEVLVSSLGDRAARLKLKYDNKNRPRVVGKDSFTADGLEDGIEQTNQLKGIQMRIWVEVMKSEAPSPFAPKEQKQLKAILAARERRKESHYYITIPPDHSSSPLANKTLLKSLLQALPSLRVIYIGEAWS